MQAILHVCYFCLLLLSAYLVWFWLTSSACGAVIINQITSQECCCCLVFRYHWLTDFGIKHKTFHRHKGGVKYAQSSITFDKTEDAIPRANYDSLEIYIQITLTWYYISNSKNIAFRFILAFQYSPFIS